MATQVIAELKMETVSIHVCFYTCLVGDFIKTKQSSSCSYTPFSFVIINIFKANTVRNFPT